MTFASKQHIDELIEKMATNPSNANKYRHEIYAYIDETYYDTDSQVAIIWSVEDVQSLDENLDDEQAMDVLEHFKENHDGSMEAMWEDLQMAVNEYGEEA